MRNVRRVAMQALSEVATTCTRLALSVLAALLVGSCTVVRPPPPTFDLPAPSTAVSSAPAGERGATAGAAIVTAAAALVGTPYHFGGADQAGFDCSGLALYVHERAGIAIPRTAVAQQQAARGVSLSALEPGDLVFFHLHGRHIDHVGIYAGDGRFIHAPHAGRKVSYADLRSSYYAHRMVSAGRFW